MEQSEKTGLDEELIVSAYFAGGAELLYGNLSKAERFALKAEETAARLGHIDWAGRARFLRGRIRFESGCYADALEIFNSLDGRSGISGAASLRQETIAAWTARAAFFLNGMKSGFSAGQPRTDLCSDGLLFEIEAACLAGNYGEAADLTKKWRASFRETGFAGAGSTGSGSFDSAGSIYSIYSIEDDFLFTEQPDWRSGFAQCELMLIPGRMLRNRFVSMYDALARSRLETSREGKEELVNNVQRLLREELLVNTDPGEVFYLHAYYRILKETSAAQVDLNTAVSMAFKRLQSRAGRIDDVDLRQSFLTRHHWNGALSRAAREYKLI
jgi:hypothetical protein